MTIIQTKVQISAKIKLENLVSTISFPIPRKNMPIANKNNATQKIILFIATSKIFIFLHQFFTFLL